MYLYYFILMCDYLSLSRFIAIPKVQLGSVAAEREQVAQRKGAMRYIIYMSVCVCDYMCAGVVYMQSGRPVTHG